MKNSENNALLSRAAELCRESEYAVSVTGFMSPGEKGDVFRHLVSLGDVDRDGIFFWGGYRGAERCTAVFLPEWYRPADPPPHKMILDEDRTNAFAEYITAHDEVLSEIPISSIRIMGSGFSHLGHRDFMGGLLALGIERSVIGDIVVLSESEGIVFVLDKIAQFIIAELTKIGRDKVVCEMCDFSPNTPFPRKFENISIQVSSARLDGVVRAITGKSREMSAQMVRSGLVELSYVQTDDVSASVSCGDVISVRGYGKYIIGETEGTTRSGRLRIACKKYI